jgi:iron(III) transport system permease protein
MDLGAWKWWVFGATLSYVLLGIVALVFGLFLRSFVMVLSPYINPLDVLTLKNYQDVLFNPSYQRAIWNTVLIAIGGAFVGTVIIGMITFVAQRSSYRLARLLDLTVQLPRAVPGLIVSLGVFYAVIFIPGLSVFGGTLWVLAFAYVIRHLPAGYGIVAPAMLQVTKDFDRAASVAGASWMTIMRRIVAPILKPAFLSCFALLMILFFKEYAAAIFLYRPGNEVISMAMLNAWVPGYTGIVASLAVIQIVLTSLLLLVFTRLFGVKLNG